MAKTKKPMVLLNTSSLTPKQKNLYNSPLFQLSKGSKELFHSNFLYWLSNVDWGVFVFVIRQLAGPSSGKFWWEANHSPSKNNIKVLREHNHFDLSIYILDGKKWRPVLVLENKVKSFPDHKQLADYEQKALNEWKPQNGAGKVTFILLSLVNPTQYHTPGGGLSGKGKWIHRSYQDLAYILKQVGLYTQYHQEILDDYIQFIKELDHLTKTGFNLSPNDSFIHKVYPWAIKGVGGDAISELGLDDLRQKLHFAQLKEMVIKKLQAKGYGSILSLPNGQTAKVTFSSNLHHNIGLADVFVEYKGHRLGVQLQGNAYQHMFCHCGGNPNITVAISHLVGNQADYGFFFDFGPKTMPCTKYPSITDQTISNRVYDKSFPSFHCAAYKPSIVYQTVHIKDSAVTVGQVPMPSWTMC